jgi:RNA polymerase sigma-70 factor (ECF subfamily)
MSNHSLHDETALVNAFRNRSDGALSELYDRYAPAMYGIIKRMVADTAVADDLLQEVFVKVWRNAERYDPESGRLFTWLVSIARNAAIDYLRSKTHKSKGLIQNVDDSVGMIERARPEVMEVDFIGMRELLEKLDPDQRTLIEMAYFQGYSQSELSETLGIPLGTIKSRMRAGLKVLRSWIS